MSDRPFRLLLDVRDLKLQFLKYVWISVCPREIRTISDLKISIINKLNINTKKINLFVREGILLDEEATVVLRDDDVVKVEFGGAFSSVQEFEIEMCGNKNRLPDKSCNEYDLQDNFTQLKKRKITVHDDVSDIKIKRKKIHNESCDNDNLYCLSSKSKKHEELMNVDVEKEISASKNKHLDCEKHKMKFVYDGETDIHVKGKELRQKSCDKFISEDILPKGKKCKTNKNVPDSGKTKAFKQKESHKNSSVENDCNENNYSCKNESSSSNPIDKDIKPCQQFKKKENVCQTNRYSDSFVVVNDESLIEGNTTKDPFISKKQVNEDEEKLSVVKTNSCLKKKRKRTRKRKGTLLEVIVPLELPTIDIANTPIQTHPKRKHIVYTSPNPYAELVDKQSVDLSSLPSDHSKNDLDVSACTYIKDNSVFNKMNTEKNISSAKVSTPIKKSDNLNLSYDASVIKYKQTTLSNLKRSPMRKEISEINNSKVNHDTEVKQVNLNSAVSDYDSMSPLTCLPEVGTKIAYKILELDENYSPTVSEFREGVVTEINNETEEMVIELLKHVIRPGRVGKFEILKDSETPSPEIIKEDIVCWNAIIEPKLLM